MPDRKGKFFLVPELWLSFGTSTYIDVAPLLGYHINDRFSVGSRTALYLPVPEGHTLLSLFIPYTCLWFEGICTICPDHQCRTISAHQPLHDLFAHVEYEGMSLEKAYFYAPAYPDDGRFIYQGLLVGGGISQRVGILNTISIHGALEP